MASVLAFMEQHPSTGRDIWLCGATAIGCRLRMAEADESAPRFSPDGRWIAYVSNESGQAEVYVRRRTVRHSSRISSQGGFGTGLGAGRRHSLLSFVRETSRVADERRTSALEFCRNAIAAEPGTFDAAGYDMMSGTSFR